MKRLRKKLLKKRKKPNFQRNETSHMDTKQAKSKTNSSSTPNYPPVVAVLGHVDHGKTTLLDAIRKTSIAAGEKGGITQKIGASSVEFLHEGQRRAITFIDTPGHEAFTKMRGRGANASDLGLLIVSAVDGVKPQTRESIKALQESQIPFIVVLTKADLPTKNIEKTRQELLKENITLEGYGGDVPVIEVSAKTNKNVKELLDLILLMFDVHKKAQEKSGFRAVVIEAKLDLRAGSKATVIIKNGTIKARDDLQINGQVFKVRTLLDTHGKPVQSATIGDAVEILGFSKVPEVGAIITDIVSGVSAAAPGEVQKLTRDLVYAKKEKVLGLSAILVADSQGSLEAIVNSLPKEIHVVAKKTGEVTEADILLAKSTGGIVLAFNTKIKSDVANFASIEKVLARNYEVIYELLDELKDALEGKLLSQIEQIYGRAKVLAKFPFEKTFAFGIAIVEGRIARGDRLRVMRGEEEIGETTITSLRVGKNSTSKVEKGNEAGIVLPGGLDIQVGDMILSHS